MEICGPVCPFLSFYLPSTPTLIILSSPFFLQHPSFLILLLTRCLVLQPAVVVQASGAREAVETHRWSGWFPLSQNWDRSHFQISGPHS